MVGFWFTIGLICLVALALGIFGVHYFMEESSIIGIIVVVVVTVIAVAGLIFGSIWFLNNTASGIRMQKEWTSEIDNGLYREITITAEDGREIFHYEGKVDIETEHDGNANYILFESEEGQRYIIYYGITDTVTIIEKAA